MKAHDHVFEQISCKLGSFASILRYRQCSHLSNNTTRQFSILSNKLITTQHSDRIKYQTKQQTLSHPTVDM